MSSKDRIETGASPALTISCRGDLVIKGWDEAAVLVGGEYEAAEKSGLWTITGQGDLRLHVPHQAALHIAEVAGDVVVKYGGADVAVDEVTGDLVLHGPSSGKVGTVQGDVVLKHLRGPVSLTTVTGDVTAAHIGDLTAGVIHGDFAAKHIDGRVAIEQVMGDVEVRSVSGSVRVDLGHGDASIAEIGGEVSLPMIHEDIILRGSLGPGNHVLNAQRDITVRWPVNTPVNLIATAPTVNNRMTLDEFEQKGEAWIGRIGDGKANLELTAGRKIELKDSDSVDDDWAGFEGATGEFVFGFDMENLGERISSQINEKIAQFTRNMETQFGPDFGREIGERMARKAEQAAQRAERAAERAAQRAEKAAERGRKGGDWGGRWADFTTPGATSSPPPSASPEEQLKILRMVEKGIISPEEAGVLLEALES